jgi:hypothetical protein
MTHDLGALSLASVKLYVHDSVLTGVFPADLFAPISTPRSRVVSDAIADLSRFAVVTEQVVDNGQPVMHRVQFLVKDWGKRKVWFDHRLHNFFSVHRNNFLWCCRGEFGGWSANLLGKLFENHRSWIQVEPYYKSSGVSTDQARSIEFRVEQHIRALEGKPAMTVQEERELKKKRGECTGCPGAMMCWGGEDLYGHDCVICGRMFIGCRGDDSDSFSPFGEIHKACDQVAWRKDVCDDCKPGYKETVNEALYSMLSSYEDHKT